MYRDPVIGLSVELINNSRSLHQVLLSALFEGKVHDSREKQSMCILNRVDFVCITLHSAVVVVTHVMYSKCSIIDKQTVFFYMMMYKFT